MTWGVEDNVIERFAAAGVPEENISFERDTYTFDFPAPPSELVSEFRAYYGPTMNAFEAAAANGREDELQAELDDLFRSQNTSTRRVAHVDSGDVPPGNGRGVRPAYAQGRRAQFGGRSRRNCSTPAYACLQSEVSSATLAP